MWCRDEIRTRGRLTTDRHATNWATQHPKYWAERGRYILYKARREQCECTSIVNAGSVLGCISTGQAKGFLKLIWFLRLPLFLWSPHLLLCSWTPCSTPNAETRESQREVMVMSYLYFSFQRAANVCAESLLDYNIHRVSMYPLNRFAPTPTTSPLPFQHPSTDLKVV